MYRKGKQIYDGKAKTLFEIEGDPTLLYQEFKNSLTAFNGVKTGSFESKGSTNRDISSRIFHLLREKGVPLHWVADEGLNGMVIKRLQIFPLEVVVRNVAAGSLAKRLGWEEGVRLPTSLVELYFKNDALGDPFINEDHAVLLKAANHDEIVRLKKLAREINIHLVDIFSRIGLDLVDFKLEFGKLPDGSILLGDEITPDCCRLWDKQTREKMDKDRFRRDLGRVQESYEEVLQRLQSKDGGAR